MCHPLAEERAADQRSADGVDAMRSKPLGKLFGDRLKAALVDEETVEVQPGIPVMAGLVLKVS